MIPPPWLAWTSVALISWGIWAVLQKPIELVLTPEQIQALSTLGMLPILFALGVSKHARLRGASRRGTAFALAGGIVSCLGNVAFFSALALSEKAATVVSLTAMAPVVTILLALIVLRERLGLVQVAGVALSLVAIWLLNDGADGGPWSQAVVYSLLPIVLWGLSGFLQKLATNHLAGERAALVYLGAFVPLGGLLAVIEPWPAEIAPHAWALALAVGFLLAFGNYAVLAAYARGGKAAVVAPLSNLYPVVSVAIAVLCLGERVGWREGLAIGCALASVGALSVEPRTGGAGTSEPMQESPSEAHH
jgi:drug/metabolite transporter (DMT)-like permease